MRPSPGDEWLEPVIAGPGANVGWDSEEDALMFAESFRERSAPSAEVVVLPEGQHPDDELQATPAGHEIPVPTRGDFDAMVRKVAPPAGRRSPGETDEPRERSD
jgi:hypothetical protein